MTQATNNVFKISCAIENKFCRKTVEDGETKMYVSGRASGNGIDHENEAMADSVIESFEKAIKDGITLPDGTWSQIPLQSAHKTEWDDTLGYLTKAWIEDGDLWVEAELIAANPNAHHLYWQLTSEDQVGRPRKKLGLSVGGRVIKAVEEWNPTVNKMIRKYTAVALQEVSVTARPAYPTAFLDALAKSVDWTQVESGKDLPMTKDISSEPAHEDVAKDVESAETHELSNVTEPLTKDTDVTDPTADTADSVSKSTVFSNWSISEVSSGAIRNLSYSLEDKVYSEVISTQKPADERIANVNELFDDFKRLLVGVISSLIRESEDTEGSLDVFRSIAPPDEGESMDVEKTIGELQEQITSMGETLKTLITDESASEEVEKAAETAETEQEAVEKTATDESDASTTEDPNASLVKSIVETMSPAFVDLLKTELKGFETRLDAIENQTVDKSISVSEAVGNKEKIVEKTLSEHIDEQVRDIKDPYVRLQTRMRLATEYVRENSSSE